jgi:hypothetical protein
MPGSPPRKGHLKAGSSRPQQCCKNVLDPRFCHLPNAAPTEVRAGMAAPTRSPCKAAWGPRSWRGRVNMTTSKRGQPLGACVTRHFSFTRLQDDLIARAYQVLIPVVSRPLAPPSRRRDHGPIPTASRDLRSKAGGA